MTPTTSTMYRADVREMTITIRNPDETPADLTGKRVLFTARTRRGSSAHYFQKSSDGGGIVISDPESGVCVMTIEAADTSSLDRTIALAYSVTVDNNPGQQITVATGQLVVEVQ